MIYIRYIMFGLGTQSSNSDSDNTNKSNLKS